MKLHKKTAQILRGFGTYFLNLRFNYLFVEVYPSHSKTN